MKQTAIAITCVLLLAGWVRAGTIVYSYDEQHRLAGANYNNQATITYAYDKANNLAEFNVLTDAQYQKPFMFWLSELDENRSPSLCRRNAVSPQASFATWKG